MLVPGVVNMEHVYIHQVLTAAACPRSCRTSVGFDVLDVLLGIFDLNGGARYEVIAPAPYVVVEVDDAEVIVDGQVVQNGLHGLHGLRRRAGLNAFCSLNTWCRRFIK